MDPIMNLVNRQGKQITILLDTLMKMYKQAVETGDNIAIKLASDALDKLLKS